ncbi:hypothetical protein [Sphingomonas sp.]|jgi:hypothetical protein|uniref:hypothetical protein n=1 Tax=Sphingomonas sp. TaxID=28214 RepID=UPI0035C87D47
MTSSPPRAADARVSTLWIMLLTLASTVTTLLLACATPFTALAALAATQMRARDGVLLMLAAWAASQITGFCWLGYPRDATTLAWAIALGSAALVATLAARTAAGATIASSPIRLAIAFVAASLAFKGVVLLWSFALGGVDIALSPAIALRQVGRNAAILAALWCAYRLLVAAGVPAAPRREAAIA